jgi:hypothetical protein
MPFLLLLIIITMILEFIFNLDKNFKSLLNYIFNYENLDINYQILIIISLFSMIIFIKFKFNFNLFQKITIKDINLNLILYIVYIILLAKVIMLPSNIIKLFFISFIN